MLTDLRTEKPSTGRYACAFGAALTVMLCVAGCSKKVEEVSPNATAVVIESSAAMPASSPASDPSLPSASSALSSPGSTSQQGSVDAASSATASSPASAASAASSPR